MTKARKPRASTKPKASKGPPPPNDVGFPLAGSQGNHPALGLGLWALGRWQPEHEARTKATLGRAVERGIHWFDTAEVYGNGRSERLLGDVLARMGPGVRRPFLSTKVSWEHLRPSQIRAALVGSLHRLGVSSIDLYLVHGPDPHVRIQDTMGALGALHAEGKVHAVGVSNFSVPELEEARRALEPLPLTANQIQYNLLNREEGDALVDYSRRHQILIEAYTPLARGLLAGRYLDREAPPAELRRWAHSEFTDDRFQVVRGRARKIRDLAEEAGVPMASIALHWLAARGVAPVFGASRPEQVDDVLHAWAQVPTAAVVDAADAISRGDGD